MLIVAGDVNDYLLISYLISITCSEYRHRSMYKTVTNHKESVSSSKIGLTPLPHMWKYNLNIKKIKKSNDDIYLYMHVGFFADSVDTASTRINISYRAEKCELHPACKKRKIGQKYKHEGYIKEG